jgi:hypothetical protein
LNEKGVDKMYSLEVIKKKKIIDSGSPEFLSKEEIKWLIEQVDENEVFMKDLVSKLDYTLSLVVKRHNEYVSLKEEIERLEKRLENAMFTDTNIKAKPHDTFEID